MMKYLATALAAVLVIGCSQEAPTTGSTAEYPPAATPAAAQANLATFVERATVSDMYAIEAGRLALERSQNAAVRSFAQSIVDARTATALQLQTALSGQTGVPVLPTALDSEHQQMLEDLRNAPANEFDAKYLDLQTEAQENTLSLMRDYADNGDNDVVRALAAQIAPAVEQHLATVRSIDRSGADETTPS